MSVKSEIIWKNKKYRILQYPKDGKTTYVKEFYTHGKHFVFDFNGLAQLQERFWFFGWSWRTLEMTNRKSLVLEWVKEYFKSEGRVREEKDEFKEIRNE